MSSKAVTSRRKFIAALGLGGAAAVSAAVLTRPAEKQEVAAKADGGKAGTGYRETAHVREYYKTARV